MKYSKSQIMSRAYKIPQLKFEDQNLTSFAGLVIFQPLMLALELKNRLWHSFHHLNLSRIFGPHIITMLLIVHLLLGYRRLRDLSYYQDDPMVKRLLVAIKRDPGKAELVPGERGFGQGDSCRSRLEDRQLIQFFRCF